MLLYHLHLWRILLIMHITSLTLKILFYVFYYRCCFSPVKSTWKQTVHKGFFISWPGLTCDAIDKYLDKSLTSSKGHLRQTQQGARSTKDVLTSEADAHPRLQRKTKEFFIKIKPLDQLLRERVHVIIVGAIFSIISRYFKINPLCQFLNTFINNKIRLRKLLS